MSKNFMDYENAEDVLTGFANEIKGNQNKTMSSPIVIDGTSCATVEDAIEALVNLIDPPIPAVLTLGQTYTFGNNGDTDIQWVCAEADNNYYVLQSYNVTGGAWPGYTMTKWGNGDYYHQDIDGQDISEYDSKTLTLYNSIKNAEFVDATYGEGIYLINIEKAGNSSGSAQVGSGYYWSTIRSGTTNVGKDNAWLGKCNGEYTQAWRIYTENGMVSTGAAQSTTTGYAIAPAFNLDPLKVTVDENNVITLK